jgi:YHS domain-containing protein
MRKLNLLALLLGLVLAALSIPALAHEHDGDDDDAPRAVSTSQAASEDPYYFGTSPTGKALGDKPVVESYEGRELRFADAADSAVFHKNPDKYIAQLDERIIADQGPLYALDVCPVTEEELGGMGEVVDYVYGNRLVRFCCGGCISEFDSDPEKYLAKIDAAAKAKQSADYPLDHCLVLPDEKFEPEHDIIVGGRLFRLCCGGCEAKVRANPAEWIEKLDQAWAGK